MSQALTESVDYQLIRNGRLLDIGNKSVDLTDILIKGDEILELGPPGLAAPEEARVIEAADRLIMPGLVNAHTHTHGALAKGRGDKWSLEMLLIANPWLSGGLLEEEKYLSAQLNAAEMVLKGCTAAYDMFFELPAPTPRGVEAVARGYQDVGVRAVIAPMMADTTFFRAIPGLLDTLPLALREQVEKLGATPYTEQLRTCEEIYTNWTFDRTYLRPAIAPTIPLHCSDEFLTGCRDLASQYDIGMQMHLAESRVQAVSAIKRYGKTLTAHLADLDLLGPRFTGAHCIWLDNEDIEHMADSGAAIAHNPGANLRLGSGVAPAQRMLHHGVTVGIGTDGSACSDNQNMFEAMRLATFVSRIASINPTEWLGSWDVLQMATQGAAKALGFNDLPLGRIAPGFKADLVLLDLGNVNFVPFNNAANQVVNSEDSSAVHSVMIGGKWVLSDRKFTAFDFTALRNKANAAAERIFTQNIDLKEKTAALEPFVKQFCIGLSATPYHINRQLGDTVGQNTRMQ